MSDAAEEWPAKGAPHSASTLANLPSHRSRHVGCPPPTTTDDYIEKTTDEATIDDDGDDDERRDAITAAGATSASRRTRRRTRRRRRRQRPYQTSSSALSSVDAVCPWRRPLSFLRSTRNEWVMRNVLRMRGCVRLELELGGVQSVVGGATVAIPHQPLQQPLATMRVAELWANHVNDVKTGQSVLRECISFDNFEKASLLDMFVKYNVDGRLKIKKLQTTALHVACTAPSGAPWVKMLCVSGSQVNEKNEERQTPLHLVLLGDLREDSCGNAEECARVLLQFGADPNADDCEGDTPLLYVRTLLQEGLHKEAASMARLLLEGGADPNRVNKQGRSLLTYSVCHLDDALALTRLLLNSGASVWGPGPEHPDQSCFSWFLKAVIQRRLLENCSQTMGLLSQVMGEAPQRMHSHVLRTMFRHVRCYQVLGPVFLQIKLSMMRYWSAPQDLKYLCWKALRKNMAPRKVVGSAARLGLPGPLQRYVLME